MILCRKHYLEKRIKLRSTDFKYVICKIYVPTHIISSARFNTYFTLTTGYVGAVMHCSNIKIVQMF